MNGRLSDAWLEELRSRVSLEEVVSEYVPLKQKGRRFWGCCPFHNEKTPSFSVDSESQLYYCFGCHKGGTVINFVMDMERMEFMDAVRLLADRAHMELPERSFQPGQERTSRDERERMYEANRETARFFHSLLWTDEGSQALNYLYGRGLNDSDIRRFGLGASPKGWDGLLRHLEGQGFEAPLLEKAGLIVQRDNGKFDMFRGRVMFPIINAQGRVLGFGGRAMGDAQPKYLNTAETPIFNKRMGLYALNFLQKERSVGRLVLVEGYMDTVSLRKYGVKGVVATLGTALTEEQVSKQAVMNKVHALRFPKGWEPPEEKKAVAYLYIEADEDHIALQYRDKKGDLTRTGKGQKNNGAITKLVYVHEGIEPEGPKSVRHRLINPHYFSRTADGCSNAELWEEVRRYIEENYDLTKVKKIYLNSDGGGWIKSGMKAVGGVVHVLDRFHLEEQLTKLTGHMKDSTQEAREELYKAVCRGTKGDFQRITERLEEHLPEGMNHERFRESRDYILCN